jgi:hypothetical protein
MRRPACLLLTIAFAGAPAHAARFDAVESELDAIVAEASRIELEVADQQEAAVRRPASSDVPADGTVGESGAYIVISAPGTHRGKAREGR